MTTASDQYTWSDIENILSAPFLASIVDAIGAQFENYRNLRKPIPVEDFYLITEGLEYAVCKVLLDHDVEV